MIKVKKLFDHHIDTTMKFPLMPIIAGAVVVCLTALLAVVSRWEKITKVPHEIHVHTAPRLTLTHDELNLLMLYFSFDSAASRLCPNPVFSTSPNERIHEDIIIHHLCMRLPIYIA